jgi:hypothetical protein
MLRIEKERMGMQLACSRLVRYSPANLVAAHTSARRGVSRRGFLLTSGAGIATALAGSSLPETAIGANAVAGTPWSHLTDGVLDAFKQHRVVALGEAHELQEFHDAVLLLLTDQRIQDTVDAIVVEFGNALYQEVIDRFMAGPW